MDITPGHQDPATGDDELAKVLASVSEDSSTQRGPLGSSGLQFEETPAPGASPTQHSPAIQTGLAHNRAAATSAEDEAPLPTGITATPPAPAADTGALEGIKRSALEELRPLVGKLDLPPEEKFDTLLLIIRSTDDQSLIEPAHDAAKAIPDEIKRAQALLDIIKEIDYFSNPQQA